MYTLNGHIFDQIIIMNEMKRGMKNDYKLDEERNDYSRISPFVGIVVALSSNERLVK